MDQNDNFLGSQVFKICCSPLHFSTVAYLTLLDGWVIDIKKALDKYSSNLRLLNILLLNLMLLRLVGAAIVKPLIAEYTQSIGAHYEKLPKIVKITLLQI